MRDAIFGQNQPRGSVPNVRAARHAGSRPVWNSGQVMQQAQVGRTIWPGGPTVSPMARRSAADVGGGGGSFLGTAAAAAAGVVGGSLLLGSIRSMMGGGHHQQAFGDTAGHAAAAKTAGRGAISPAAIWRGTPASTTSARPASAPTQR